MRNCRLSRRLAGTVFLTSVLVWGATGHAGDTVTREPLPGFVPQPRPISGNLRWQMAHKFPAGEIHAVAWSPDGKRIACSDLKYLRICDAQTFKTQAVLVGHHSRVTSIDWNRSNNRIASASYDGAVRIWSAEGVPLRVIDPRSGRVHAVAWAKDGSRLASAGEDGKVRIWREDGSEGPVINASESAIDCVTWSPDGKQLASGDNDYLVKMWNADGSPGPVCKGHLARVTDLAWSPDGKRLASSTWGYKPSGTDTYYVDVRFWNADGSPAGTLTGEMPNYGICWSPDSRHLAVISEGGQVRIVSPAGELESTRPVPQRLLSAGPLAWSPDGQELASAGSGMLCVLRIADGTTRQSPRIETDGSANIVPRDGVPNRNLEKWIFRSAADSPWQVWNADGSPGPKMSDDVPTDKVSQVVWNPVRDQVAFVENGLRLRVWSPGSVSAKVIKELPEQVGMLAWSPDGETLAVSDQSTMRFIRSDGTAIFEHKLAGPAVARGSDRDYSAVRFAIKGEHIAIVEPNQVVVVKRDGTPVTTVAFDPPVDMLNGSWLWWSSDGAHMTTLRGQGEKGGNLMARDLEKGTSRKLSEFPDEIVCADCSPNGKMILTGYDGGEWELQHLDRSDVPSLSVPGHLNGTILAAIFAPDAQRFATGGWDTVIRIWSLDGECQQSFFGNGLPIQSLTWSSDGKRLLSRARDRSMQVWSIAAGRPELIISPLADGTWLVLTADGRRPGGSEAGINRTFVFLCEQPSGAMQLVDYSTFLKRAGEQPKATR